MRPIECEPQFSGHLWCHPFCGRRHLVTNPHIPVSVCIASIASSVLIVQCELACVVKATTQFTMKRRKASDHSAHHWCFSRTRPLLCVWLSQRDWHYKTGPLKPLPSKLSRACAHLFSSPLDALQFPSRSRGLLFSSFAASCHLHTIVLMLLCLILSFAVHQSTCLVYDGKCFYSLSAQ